MTSRTPARPANRAAFTLPELLVVVTVTLILMSILVQASTIITSTVSAAKAQGDFVGQERMAIAVMRRDLQADHFLEEDGKPNQGRRLSDQRTDQATASGTQIMGYKPPLSGYFWASAKGVDNVSNFDEGTDSSGFTSSRSGNHIMQFTIVLPGGAPENTLNADIPFQSTAATTGTCAEVAYFLVSNGTTPTGIAKYKLIRRQRIAARNKDDQPAYRTILNSFTTAQIQATDPPEVMAATGTVGNFNVFNLHDLSQAGNRFGSVSIPRAAISTHRVGEDVLHNHVISFELKFTGSGRTETNGPWPRPFGLPTNNTDYPFDTLPFDGNYDTGDETLNATAGLATSASNQSNPIKPIRITGVQIRLRYWNPSNRQTRQTTTVVDL